jgi:hypothetical protein
MLYTLKEVAEFCYANKRQQAFRGCTFEQVARDVIRADRDNKLHIAADDIGLCGVVIATEQPATKRVYINQIVTVRRGFRILVEEAFKRFPDYSIAGIRYSTLKVFTKRNLYGR